MAKNKKQHISQTFFTIVMLVVIYILSEMVFFRIDLTTDKRYTLSKTTKQTLKNLDDMAYIRVYLDGDMPLQFKEMQQSITDLLTEYKVYAKENLEFEVVNPYETEDREVREELFGYLNQVGLQPVNVQDTDEEGGRTQKLIFPGAIIYYHDIELGINLLKNNPGLPAEVNLNNSIQSLEYEFTNKLKNLSDTSQKKIAFIEGHGELDQWQTGDITRALANYYQVDRGQINGMPGILDDYLAVIVAKPQQAFSEADKFVLDQYIMQGGKVVWLVEPVKIEMDSLIQGSTLALIRDLNLDDMFFKYGIRINPDLIKDIQSNIIPVNTAVGGAQSNFQPAPWLYYPLAGPNPGHPITTNLNFVKTEFVSSIDTVGGNANLSKTVLLSSSRFSKTVNAPLLVSLDEIDQQPNRQEFNDPFQPMAVLVEGTFESVFQNRPYEKYLAGKQVDSFYPESEKSGMVFISDGDIIRNPVNYRNGGPAVAPLGYDRFTKQTFGNKEFILNTVNYLTDESGLMDLRTRQLTLRLLDKTKLDTKAKKQIWRWVNTIIPVLLILILGIMVNIIRKRKWAR
ncbi:MAG: gliding motility-associated ABC transporter substrate-binding protein GldG [Bacteroidota bacterium]